jgi:hypothetical protein
MITARVETGCVAEPMTQKMWTVVGVEADTAARKDVDETGEYGDVAICVIPLDTSGVVSSACFAGCVGPGGTAGNGAGV